MEQFGKYQLIRRIGSGGMAEVFLARTTVAQGLAKELVIKKIHPAFARSRQFVAMFVDEAKIALGLNHPNIVQVFDFGQVGQTFFLAMEYVEGFDLLRIMQEAARNQQRIPLGLAAYIVQQIAKGLDYAHRKSDDFGEPLGIVHRDISPQNVLVSRDGAVKIVDFGIARARHIDEEEGVVKGKFAYMAPEQARGELVDRRADLFSAGVVLYELSCGRPLFPGKGKDVLDKVKAGEFSRPREVVPDLPEELEKIILGALSARATDRFQTGRDLQNALGRFQFSWAQSHAGLVDSGSLAQLIDGLLPREERRERRRTGTTPGSTRARQKHLADGTNSEDMASRAGGDSTRARRELRERKAVFVVQGRIRGRGLLEERIGKDEAAKVVAQFLAVARDIAFKHEAHVHEVCDEGFTMAVGLPVASDDDAPRTIRLALALVEALDGIGHDVEPELRLAVGIQRGAAIVARRDKGRFRCELSSATTDIARRLADEAAGADILVGGAVYQLSRADWNFEAVSTVELTESGTGTDSGHDTGGARARVYRLRSRKERQQRLLERGRSVDVVGRDLELKALRDAYRDCHVRGSQRFLAITGEDGVGKRALVSALLDTIPEGEATVFHASGRAATSYTPFGIIADAARDVLGLAEGAEPHEIRKRIDLMVELLYPPGSDDGGARDLASAAALLFGVQSEDARKLEPDEMRRRLIAITSRIEQRFSPDKPIVMVADNFHWADRESMSICRDLINVPNSRGLFILLTSRPEPSVIKLAGEAGAEFIRIDELDAVSRVELVRRRFVPGEDVGELAQKIIARAGGNPFFICEMIDSLVDRGILAAEPEGADHPGLLRWIDRDAPIVVPTSIEAVLATRIDQLPDPLKDTLVHAAVLGARFSTAEVERLVERPVAGELADLCQRGLLRDDGDAHSFRNDMTMTVAYRTVPDEERAALHRVVSSALVQSPSYRPGQDDAVVARHLELAGDSSAAADRYLRAANHAVNVGGNSDAFRQLSRALRLLPERDHQRRFAARSQREEILRRMAQRPAQLREIDALRKDAEAIGDPGKLARAHARLVQYHIDMGKAQAAQKAVASALQYARDSGDPVAEAEALRLRSSIARLGGRNAEALALCDQAIALLGTDRDGLEERALILMNRGTSLWNMDRLHEAIEAFAEGLIIYRQLGLPRQEARALNNMGIVFGALGEPEEALAHYKSALKIDQRLGDRAAIALKLGNIGQIYTELGDPARGERYLSRAFDLTEAQDDRASMVDVVNSLGQVALAKGDLTAAIASFRRGRQLAIEHQNRYQEIRALVYLALASCEGDADVDAEAALGFARTATKMAQEMTMPVGEVYGLAAQGVALGRLGRAAEAAELSRRAVERLDASEQSEGREQIFSIHARLCEAAGLIDEAIAAIRRSHAEVERKASGLRDRDLQLSYRRAPVPSAIALHYQRLVPPEPPPDSEASA